MSVKKRGSTYYIIFRFQGKLIRKSTAQGNRQVALELEAKLKKELWDAAYKNKLPEKEWLDAAIAYLNEKTKKTINDDIKILNWINHHWAATPLKQIKSQKIDDLKQIKINENVAPATVNHYLQVIGAVLKRAHQLGWIEGLPHIQKMSVQNKRTRWLTKTEAENLIIHLPPHLAVMARFTLATGLRASNVRLLKWYQINLEKAHAFIPVELSKNKKALGIPLNLKALEILKEQPVINDYVFNYKGKPVSQCSTKAFRKAREKANIKNFRWHDLRHTWASWHIQAGTSIQELQALGGWEDIKMVMRYAHLSSGQLKQAAERINSQEVFPDSSQNVFELKKKKA